MLILAITSLVLAACFFFNSGACSRTTDGNERAVGPFTWEWLFQSSLLFFFVSSGQGHAKASWRLDPTNLQVMGVVKRGDRIYVLGIRPDQKVRLYQFDKANAFKVEVGRFHFVTSEAEGMTIVPFEREPQIITLESARQK